MPHDNLVNDIGDFQNVFIDKYVWEQTKRKHYNESLASESSVKMIREATQLIQMDIDKALCKFNELIKRSAEDMKKRICIGRKRKENTWFDQECRSFRNSVRKALRRYRRTLDSDDCFKLCKIRREYKNLVHLKKKLFNELMINKLITSIGNQQDF